MITYKLALALKNAGFPQNNHYYVKEDGIVSDVCIPTLSELIEACGDSVEVGNDCYPYNGTKWRASTGYDGCSGYDNAVYGSTPEEALALLLVRIK